MLILFISLLTLPFLMAMEHFNQSDQNKRVSVFKINATSLIIQGSKAIQADVVYISKKDAGLIAAVFDGNGGIGQKTIENDLLQRLIKCFNKDMFSNTTDISNCFKTVNDELAKINIVNEDGYTVQPWESAGSTALLLFFIPESNQFIISWCGDSGAIWSENGHLQSISRVHHLEERAGQYSFYRSFGNFIANDKGQSNFIEKSGFSMSADPDSIIIDITSDNPWLLFATDGLWTHTSKKEVFYFVNDCLKKREQELNDGNSLFEDIAAKGGVIAEKKYSDQDIVNRIMLLSILNDVQHNLLSNWFQFFVKEYIRIICPALRRKNVALESYIKKLQDSVSAFYEFISAVQFTIEDFPFIINPSGRLQVRQYDAQVPIDAVGKPQGPIIHYPLAATIKKYDFVPLTDKNRDKDVLNLSLLINNMDDGNLPARLKEIFDSPIIDEDLLLGIADHPFNNDFWIFLYLFIIDMRRCFQQTVEAIENRKKEYLLFLSKQAVLKVINKIQNHASDNTSIVFITTKKDEKDRLSEGPDTKNAQEKVDLAKKDNVQAKAKSQVTLNKNTSHHNNKIAGDKIEKNDQSALVSSKVYQQPQRSLQSDSVIEEMFDDNGNEQSIFSYLLSGIASFFSSIFQFFANLLSF